MFSPLLFASQIVLADNQLYEKLKHSLESPEDPFFHRDNSGNHINDTVQFDRMPDFYTDGVLQCSAGGLTNTQFVSPFHLIPKKHNLTPESFTLLLSKIRSAYNGFEHKLQHRALVVGAQNWTDRALGINYKASLNLATTLIFALLESRTPV